MTEPLGRRRWAIAEGYIPGRSTGPKPELENHETCCILNTGDRDALVRLMV
ncbi:MAG: sensory rhodopsin transducer [Pseudomonadota bacterium]